MKHLSVISILILLTARVGALSLSGFGVSVVSSTSDDERTIATLQDKTGSFTLSYVEEPSTATLGQMMKLRSLYYSWPDVKVDTLQFTVTGDLIETSLVPSQIVVDGKDLSEYVPAGLFLSWTDSLEYDFRVATSGLFLRVYGPFTTEQEMVKKIAAAVASPSTYLVRSDPEYVLNRLDDTNKTVTLLQAALDESRAALAAELEKDRTALEGELSSARAENDKLRKELEATRAAAMMTENVEWLFFKKPLPPDGVARVVELKQATPSLKVQDVAAQLKTDGIAMTNQEIYLVFKYYFNEY